MWYLDVDDAFLKPELSGRGALVAGPVLLRRELRVAGQVVVVAQARVHCRHTQAGVVHREIYADLFRYIHAIIHCTYCRIYNHLHIEIPLGEVQPS